MAGHDGELEDLSGRRDLPIDEDMVFQCLSWRVARIGWLVLLGIVVLALLGFFSGGWLSDTVARGADGGRSVQYERFARDGAGARFVLRYRAAPARFTVELDRAFLDAFSLEGVTPAPARMESAGDGVRLHFEAAAAAAAGAGEQGDSAVYLDTRARSFGLVESRVGIDGETLALLQFLYP